MHIVSAVVYVETNCSAVQYILFSTFFLSLSLSLSLHRQSSFLGLFSGSGGGKGQLLDSDMETGKLIHTAKRAHRLDKPSPGA